MSNTNIDNKTDIICHYCGGITLFKETPENIHYGRLDCQKCGRFIKWVGNPNKERHASSTSDKRMEQVLRYHNIKEEICFICLRNRNQLGTSETLTLDHIKELSKGGEDSIFNMQVLCTACHKLKNWARLYINWHNIKKDGVKNE